MFGGHFKVLTPGGRRGGAAVGNGCGINTDALPLKLLANGSCVPWFAHQELRVNTLFEVAKAGNFITGFADKHLIYEVRGGAWKRKRGFLIPRLR